MIKRPPFVLPVHADPCAELPVERGPSNEGVGWWVPQVKHTYLAKYIDGTRKAQVKFPNRVLIDPFCGPGRVQVKGEFHPRWWRPGCMASVGRFALPVHPCIDRRP